MKTFSATPKDITHDWHVDRRRWGPARTARQRRGAAHPGQSTSRRFTPHMDGGDFVVVLNASKVKLTGRKLAQKTYFRTPATWAMSRYAWRRTCSDTHPDRVIEKAVFGMLPKNSWPSSTCGASSRCTRARSIRTRRSSRSRSPLPACRR
jgi:large subunit ribosomal protein L13